MKISVDDLIGRVKVNMEELTDPYNESVSLEGGIDVVAYIREKLPDALLSVWASVPVEMLPQTDCASSLQPERRPDGSGRVVLPADVWRMTEFCMEGWRQPVTTFIDRTSPAYELQFNPYTRGGVAFPVCVLSNESGGKCLDYYSLPPCTEAHRVKTARYVAYPQPSNGHYEIAESLIPTVCYTCAALVFEILSRPEQAAAMLRSIVR